MDNSNYIDLSLDDKIRLARVNGMLAWAHALVAEEAADACQGVGERHLRGLFQESQQGTVYAKYWDDGEERTVELEGLLLDEYRSLMKLVAKIDAFGNELAKLDTAWSKAHAERDAVYQHLRTSSKLEKIKGMPQGRYVSRRAKDNVLSTVYVKTGMQWLRNGMEHVDSENLPDDLIPLTA